MLRVNRVASKASARDADSAPAGSPGSGPDLSDALCEAFWREALGDMRLW
jgi:hypothetical protein